MRIAEPAGPRSYYPGQRFEICVEARLESGEYPIATLWGPCSVEERFRKQLPTTPTILPKRDGETFHLFGEIPAGTLPGIYELLHVEVFYSITGTADAEHRATKHGEDLNPYSIEVKPAPQEPRKPPTISRVY